MFTSKPLPASVPVFASGPGRYVIRLPAAFVLAAFLGLLVWTVPGYSQVCEDIDGDGWGWDGSDTCLVTPVPANAGDCVDEDGDGYGWNGQETCLARTPNSTASTELSGSSGGACIDDDGDGWGWNGQDSCVAAATVSAPPTVAPQSPPVTEPPLLVLTEAPSIGNSSFNRQRDLVALHFDHAPDRDDGHAAVAALMVKDKFALNVQVVAGTHGVYSRDRYDAASEGVMAAVWGSEWLNAHSNREGSVNAAVNRWASVLAAGGSVWVAEGGPSDFTAEVVRRIKRNHSEFDTARRINVIQHSDWNENHALAADLDYTRSNTSYVKIADGNDPNATADFRAESNINSAFVSRAQSSSYSNQWAVAFNYLTPGEKLDFSDTVELMYIVGLGTNVISDVNEFGNYFF